jgi:diphosphoinositol-polyphosphate diphosphatase
MKGVFIPLAAVLTPTGSRTGRDAQRYSAKGERMVIGTIPFTAESPPRVLLINSRKHPEEWLLPKGGWESDETRAECAVRESWEEAGVVGKLVSLQGAAQEEEREREREKEGGEDKDQPLLLDFSVQGKNHDQLHTYYALLIADMKADWPERAERGRQLFSLAAAREVLGAQGRRRDREAQSAVLELLARHFSE